MSDLGDLFGDFPARPDTPDFWRLSEIILQMDGAVAEARTEEEREVAWKRFFDKHVSTHAIYYMGIQRAMLALGLSTAGDLSRHHELITKMATIYAEAFAVGTQYMERGGRP